jgi:hypothetical protein
LVSGRAGWRRIGRVSHSSLRYSTQQGVEFRLWLKIELENRRWPQKSARLKRAN